MQRLARTWMAIAVMVLASACTNSDADTSPDVSPANTDDTAASAESDPPQPAEAEARTSVVLVGIELATGSVGLALEEVDFGEPPGLGIGTIDAMDTDEWVEPDAVLSPNGRLVAVPDGDNESIAIYEQSQDGFFAFRSRTRAPAGTLVGLPQFSPDSTQVAFVTFEGQAFLEFSNGIGFGDVAGTSTDWVPIDGPFRSVGWAGESFLVSTGESQLVAVNKTGLSGLGWDLGSGRFASGSVSPDGTQMVAYFRDEGFDVPTEVRLFDMASGESDVLFETDPESLPFPAHWSTDQNAVAIGLIRVNDEGATTTVRLLQPATRDWQDFEVGNAAVGAVSPSSDYVLLEVGGSVTTFGELAYLDISTGEVSLSGDTGLVLGWSVLGAEPDTTLDLEPSAPDAALPDEIVRDGGSGGCSPCADVVHADFNNDGTDDAVVFQADPDVNTGEWRQPPELTVIDGTDVASPRSTIAVDYDGFSGSSQYPRLVDLVSFDDQTVVIIATGRISGATFYQAVVINQDLSTALLDESPALDWFDSGDSAELFGCNADGRFVSMTATLNFDNPSASTRELTTWSLEGTQLTSSASSTETFQAGDINLLEGDVGVTPCFDRSSN